MTNDTEDTKALVGIYAERLLKHVSHTRSGGQPDWVEAQNCVIKLNKLLEELMGPTDEQ